MKFRMRYIVFAALSAAVLTAIWLRALLDERRRLAAWRHWHTAIRRHSIYQSSTPAAFILSFLNNKDTRRQPDAQLELVLALAAFSRRRAPDADVMLLSFGEWDYARKSYKNLLNNVCYALRHGLHFALSVKPQYR